jgi:hypothetical protein
MSHCVFALIVTTLAAFTGGDEPAARPDDHAAYSAAAVKAGKDPDAHVRLAMWCASRGLVPERDLELAAALRLSPDHAAARGLSGMVRVEGHWVRPDDVAAKAETDPTRRARLAAYDAKRDQAGDAALDQMKLAAWCAGQGLIDESRAHYAAALRLDPTQPEAWRRLGYRFHEDHWVNEVHEVQAKRQFAEAKTAYHHWETKLTRLARERANPETRRTADSELATVKDADAAPAVWSVFVSGGERFHNVAVRLLEQIDGPEATSRLALLALFENEVPVRDPATDALTRRDPREFVGPVIDYLRLPLKIEVREAGGPEAPGALLVDGQIVQEYRIPTFEQYRDGWRSLNPPPAINPYGFAADPHHYVSHTYQYTVTYHPPDPAVAQAFQQAVANPGEASQIIAGLASSKHTAPPPVMFNVTVRAPSQNTYRAPPSQPNYAAANRAARELQKGYDSYVKNVKRQLKNDAAALERYNTRLQEVAGHAHEILKDVTGLSFDLDQATWGAWWTAWNATEGHTPTQVGATPVLAAPPQPAPAPTPSAKLHRSRLAEGTPVWTDRGRRPVETLRVGSRVLTQDVHTGTLGYTSVVDTTLAAQDDLFRVVLGGRRVLTVTPLERLWRSGHGWVVARDLKPGDVVRTLGDVAPVVDIEAIPARPTFNVALFEGHALFAGDPAVLVHDNGIVRPPGKPFDAVADLDASAAAESVGRSRP